MECGLTFKVSVGMCGSDLEGLVWNDEVRSDDAICDEGELKLHGLYQIVLGYAGRFGEYLRCLKNLILRVKIGGIVCSETCQCLSDLTEFDLPCQSLFV